MAPASVNRPATTAGPTTSSAEPGVPNAAKAVRISVLSLDEPTAAISNTSRVAGVNPEIRPAKARSSRADIANG